MSRRVSVPLSKVQPPSELIPLGCRGNSATTFPRRSRDLNQNASPKVLRVLDVQIHSECADIAGFGRANNRAIG